MRKRKNKKKLSFSKLKKVSLLKKQGKEKVKHIFESGLFFIERARLGMGESVRKVIMFEGCLI